MKVVVGFSFALTLISGWASPLLPPPISTVTPTVRGKNIIVTGATHGGTLGGCIATALARSGAKGLIIVGRKPQEMPSDSQSFEDNLNFEYPNCDVHYCACDLSSAAECDALVRRADKIFDGNIDGLVNAAGVAFPRATLDETTPDSFDRMMAINVRAPLLLSQGVARIMKKKGIYGSIVNIGSIASYGGAPFISAYSMSKAALNAQTRVAAVELQPARIRVNCLSIGWTLTANEANEQAASRGEDWLVEAEASQRIGRLLRPEDITPTVLHLLSNSSNMITGSIWDVSPEWVQGCLPNDGVGE
jgi:NAD(P)-dependent dehydrogenase (short-subunit alcohol dehydrogenase family)